MTGSQQRAFEAALDRFLDGRADYQELDAALDEMLGGGEEGRRHALAWLEVAGARGVPRNVLAALRGRVASAGGITINNRPKML